jgi:hypothetical protein
MFRYFAALVIFGCIAITAQTNQNSVVRQKPRIDRIAEDRVAQTLDAMRKEERLPRLKRQQPSREEVQLVCTAAVTGSAVHDPKFGTLDVYSTDDLSERPENLKVIAFGTSYDPQSATRYQVYSDKDWGRYAVVVYSSRSTSGRPPSLLARAAIRA